MFRVGGLIVTLLFVAYGTVTAGVYNKEHTWVDGNLTLPFPANAVIGGFDPYGYYIYIGRIIYSNSVLPARVVPELGIAYFNTDTLSSKAYQYQLLAKRPNVEYVWIRSFDGYREADAISVGTSAADERVYICRAKADGGLLVGTLLLSQKVCIIKHEDSPLRKYDKYEVLVAEANEAQIVPAM